MISLERQLRRSLLLTLGVVMVVLLFLVNIGVEQITRGYILTRLQHDTDSLIAALSKDSKGGWRVDANRIGTIYSRVQSGHYYAAFIGEQSFRSRSLWDYPLEPVQLEPGRQLHLQIPGPGAEQWLVWSQGIRKQGADITLWVAEDIAPLQIDRYRYTAWALLLIAVALALLMVVQQWLLRRSFRALDRVRQSIRSLRSGESPELSDPVPQEVQPLVSEIERLLEQLSQRVARSRNALGNLAHELKRPMQRLSALAEGMEQRQCQEITATLDEVRRLLERELKRARIVGVSSPGRQMMVAKELPSLVTVMRKIYPHCSIETDYPGGLILPQDRDDLLELLGNLLDNACKFARSRVELRLEEREDGWQLQVRDDGKGVESSRLAEIAERGVRLDESVAGHGLGLSICRDIVDSYGGTLTFLSAPVVETTVEATVETASEGLCVTVFLPRP